MSFNAFKISTKLALAFASVIFIVVSVSAVSVYSNSRARSATDWTQHSYEVIDLITQFQTSMLNEESALRAYILTGDESYLPRLEENRAEVLSALANFAKATSDNSVQQDQIRSLSETVDRWHARGTAKPLDIAKDSGYDAARTYLRTRPVSDLRATIDQLASSMVDEERRLLVIRTGNQTTAMDWATWAIIIGGLLSTAGAAVMAFLLSKSIARPVRRMTQAMRSLARGETQLDIPGRDRLDEIGEMAEAVEVFRQSEIERVRLSTDAEAARQNEVLAKERQAAIESAKAEDLRVLVTAVETSFDRLSEGDLTIRMNQKLAPEFEPIRVKFNDSVSQLEEAIGGVVSSVQTIRTGLSEIAVASNDLSQRTEQQAASIEETVAALSDVSRGVAETAQNAGKARETARTAAAKAEEGGTIVGRAVSAMEEIEGSSQKINDIIGVIDEIAFQTNLLALNAGVEAARAGEAGKGFAVVAQEVRELAQRSATAAKEIKDLISTSREKVGTGVDLVTASGRSLEEIVAEVNAMAEVISTIASSATEQASSLREVSGAADQMDKVTQQNAAMVEETTAATKNVEAETDMLATSVARFAISAGGNRSSQSGRTPAASRPAAKPAAKPSVAAAGSGQKPVASPVHAMQDRLAKGTAPKRAAPAAARGANALARKDEDWTEF